jgi:NTE family protein
MKRIVSIIVLLVAFAQLEAQPGGGAVVPKPQRPKVGVALSGGGAKGAAHIGVLKYMEEIGIPVDYVTGTSMGSIIGGLYALGYSPDEMAELIAAMNWALYMSNNVDRKYMSSERREFSSVYMLSVPFGTGEFQEKSRRLISTLPSGVINGASLINLFSMLSVGYNDSIDFNTLPIPFACVATDIINGDSVVLHSGVFAKAIRSSMAIPGVFSPVEWEGHLLADGGLVNNFPVDVCLDMGADYVIGVDLADALAGSIDDLRSLPQQLSQYLSIAVTSDHNKHREMCDIYMHPDVSGYNMLSFSASAIDTLVRRGYECAKAHHDELMRLKQRLEVFGPCKKTLQAPRARLLTVQDTFVLAEVEYKGVGPDERHWLERKDGLDNGTAITIRDIENAIGIINGTGAYSKITYTIFETDEEFWLNHHVYTDAVGRESYRLVVSVEYAEPHLFAVGFRYDSEESASLLFHAGWNERRLSGFKLGMDVDLNYNFRFGARGSWCGLGLGDVTLGYKYHNSSLNINYYDSISLLGRRIDHHNISLYISEFHLLDFSFAFGIDEDFYSNRGGFTLNNMLYDGLFHFDRTENFLGVFFRGRYDNLDNAYFATKGVYATGGASWRKNNKHLFRDIDSGFVAVDFNVQSYISTSPRFTLIPQVAARMVLGNNSGWYDNLVGGTLSGRYLDHQLAFVGLINPLHVDDMAAILRLDMRYNIYSKFYLYLMANYLFSFDEMAPLDSWKGSFGTAFRVSYDSPIGPVSVDLHWNNFNRRLGAYLNIGYVF